VYPFIATRLVRLQDEEWSGERVALEPGVEAEE
jgi:hypothetical protein